jgi:palmitoyl-protein thioesterase
MKTSLALLAIGAQAILARPNHHRNNNDDNDDTPLPLVIWHGLGDAFNGEGLQEVGALAEAANPGTFVYTISLGGSDANADRSATFFGNVTAQIEQVCDALASHPILSTAPAIDAIGFSQGGQFLRGYVEKCNNPPVRSLVTFGSQHNGIIEFKACGPIDWLCKGAMALLRFNTWSTFVSPVSCRRSTTAILTPRRIMPPTSNHPTSSPT